MYWVLLEYYSQCSPANNSLVGRLQIFPVNKAAEHSKNNFIVLSIIAQWDLRKNFFTLTNYIIPMTTVAIAIWGYRRRSISFSNSVLSSRLWFLIVGLHVWTWPSTLRENKKLLICAADRQQATLKTSASDSPSNLKIQYLETASRVMSNSFCYRTHLLTFAIRKIACKAL